jgi:hypothetical protein
LRFVVALVGGHGRAGSRPGMPGNFHLLAQMKVTKAKGLKTKTMPSFCAPRAIGPAGHLARPQLVGPTARSTPRARFASPWKRAAKGEAKRARGVERGDAVIELGGQKWPAGPTSQGAKNERMVFVLRPFALVTFIWASK